MPKLEAEPRLTSVKSDVMEWARRVVGALNPNTDSVAALLDAVGTIRKPATSIIDTLDGPCFSASISVSQVVTSATFTVALLDAIEFNIGSGYTAATGKFQPSIAGYYQINCTLDMECSSGFISNGQLFIFKNGANLVRLSVDLSTSSASLIRSGSRVVFLNGTSDYIQLVGYLNAGGTTTFGIASTTLTGHLARRA